MFHCIQVFSSALYDDHDSLRMPAPEYDKVALSGRPNEGRSWAAAAPIRNAVNTSFDVVDSLIAWSGTAADQFDVIRSGENDSQDISKD